MDHQNRDAYLRNVFFVLGAVQNFSSVLDAFLH